MQWQLLLSVLTSCPVTHVHGRARVPDHTSTRRKKPCALAVSLDSAAAEQGGKASHARAPLPRPPLISRGRVPLFLTSVRPTRLKQSGGPAHSSTGFKSPRCGAPSTDQVLQVRECCPNRSPRPLVGCARLSSSHLGVTSRKTGPRGFPTQLCGRRGSALRRGRLLPGAWRVPVRPYGSVNIFTLLLKPRSGAPDPAGCHWDRSSGMRQTILILPPWTSRDMF